jgi:hypothetical protein
MDFINPPAMRESQLSSTKIQRVLLDGEAQSLRQGFMHGVSWNLVGTILAQGSVLVANVGIAFLRYKMLRAWAASPG